MKYKLGLTNKGNRDHSRLSQITRLALLLRCHQRRVAVVLFDPKGNTVFLVVGLDQIIAEFAAGTANIEMMIN